MLFQQLELSGLESWPYKNQAAIRVLLAEYHDIFSLEPGELGWAVLLLGLRVAVIVLLIEQ